MKLVRYGTIGRKSPALSIIGSLRDLSDHVKDLNGEAYAPAALAKLAPRPRQASGGRRQARMAAGDRHLEIRRHRPDYVDHAKETARRSRPSRSSS